MEASSKLSGGCLCGAVRFEARGEPQMTVNCHCLSCQKLSGAGHTFHAMVADADFTVSGTAKGYDWIADSGNRVTTSFCPECGSPLFARSSGYPGMVTFRVASLDHPVEMTPKMSVYSKRLQSWDQLAPSVPAFPEIPAMAASA